MKKKIRRQARKEVRRLLKLLVKTMREHYCHARMQHAINTMLERS